MIANEPDCFGNFFPDPNCYACLCHEECEEAKQQDLIDKSNFKPVAELDACPWTDRPKELQR